MLAMLMNQIVPEKMVYDMTNASGQCAADSTAFPLRHSVQSHLKKLRQEMCVNI